MVNDYELWFGSLYNLSSSKKYTLLKELSAENIFKIKDFNNLNLTKEQVVEIVSTASKSYIEKLKLRLKNNNAKYIYNLSKDFPPRLKTIPNPPFGIFTCGKNIDLTRPVIGIIGSRIPTGYGNQIAYELSYRLSPYCTILSGLAKGIDATAHHGCIDSNGYTIGIIGGGIDNIYPICNKSLYEKIRTTGTIISEFAPKIGAKKWHFPARNRLIAGLCDILIVVEASIKSGTSGTVDEALALGKDVFAVPGRITDKNSHGCLKLIRDGSYMLCSYKDILEHLNISELCESKNNTDILGILQTPKSIEDIIAITKLPKNDLFSLLLELEMKNLVEQFMPGIFRKI